MGYVQKTKEVLIKFVGAWSVVPAARPPFKNER